MNKGKIIIALDVSSKLEAIEIIDKLGFNPWAYKIGLQLFVNEGPSIISIVKSRGARVFLDLKFYDIPNTVYRAVQSAVSLEVDLLTIHLSGGKEMLEAAVEGAKDSSCLLLGVSVLTSSDDSTLSEVGISSDVTAQVERLVGLGCDVGLGGVVASPLEIRSIREKYGNQLKVVTPGVRPATSAKNDQKRIMTPGEAIKAGADALVIGRPIMSATDPLLALKEIQREIEAVTS